MQKGKKNTIVSTTLKHDLCINCGICKTACPQSAIKMIANKYGELNPIIDKTKCTNCGICAKVCPNAKESMKAESEKLSNYNLPQAYGLQDAKFYVAWNRNIDERQKCCSGGVVTALAKYLFENKLIDGMIHAERVWGTEENNIMVSD